MTDDALGEWLLATADDQLILAHRDSEWTGHAPILEEDIALANIAQDELGHATLWYGLLAELRGEDETYADRLVFGRPAPAWRNARLVELPKGDWAFTMLRQYILDAYEHVQLERLERSAHPGVAAVAAKIRREELYHLRHSSTWVKRLALGSDESRRRTRQALAEQWPYLAQLFAPVPGEEALVAAGIVPAASELRAAWRNLAEPLLAECELEVLALDEAVPDRARHTPHLDELLGELQQVARLDPEAEW